MQAIPFDNSYARLPDSFFSAQLPTPVPAPGEIRINDALAQSLGIDPAWLRSEEGLAVMAGNVVPEGATPISTVYAGHQFGNWNPQLGDGRAVLLGEVLSTTGERFDIQLKGSGPTPYSRGGDGRAPLGPVLREYVVSEAMFALGIPTTRSLAAVTTGDKVYREVPEPGGVLCRVAHSHIRVGTFQYFASRGYHDELAALTGHALARHYPEAAGADNPALALLDAVVTAQASLIAAWQATGFIHGVMNTDNMLISGETVDYGPCAFMDNYHQDTVYSSIDVGGRYAYKNQPGIGHWNLMGLAQALLPLLGADEDAAVEGAKAALDTYPERFLNAHRARMLAKIGLSYRDADDEALVRDLLEAMQSANLDYTGTFRLLARVIAGEKEAPDILKDWVVRWQARVGGEDVAAAMDQVNPVYIPRNHLIELAIIAAVNDGDFQPFHDLVDVLENPFEARAGLERYASGPGEGEVVQRTFCGT